MARRRCAALPSPRLSRRSPPVRADVSGSALNARPSGLSVSGNDRAALLLPDLVRLAVQVKEPPSFASSRHRSIPLHPISKVAAPLKELFFFGNFCKTPGEA